jgi:nicotinate-nucleotide pyrophosphorylase (carboxylating)
VTSPPQHVVEQALRAALAEDLGSAGDLTSQAVIPEGALIEASIVTRQSGVVAGLTMSLQAFAFVNPSVTTVVATPDSSRVTAGTELASVAGPAIAVLAAERSCLNMLGHLSGIATAARQLVDLVAHTSARIVDTRKTTPGLRALEKYAVRVGGGSNHRFGLFDAVLIKDNHLQAAGGIEAAVKSAKRAVGHLVKVEIEIDDVADLENAIRAGADTVLLDNMSPDQMRQAVSIAKGRVLLEASGGITPELVVAIAETGVDLISLGWLTNSAPRWDVALDLIDNAIRSG